MPPTMSPSRARLVFAAMNPSVVQPSSIGSSAGPSPRIWKKWSMTQSESKPASSALRTIRASVGPMAGVPPGQLNLLIWRPIFMARDPCAGLGLTSPAYSGTREGVRRRPDEPSRLVRREAAHRARTGAGPAGADPVQMPAGANRLAEQVELGRHEDVPDDAAGAGRRGSAADERGRPAGRLAQHQLRGRG